MKLSSTIYNCQGCGKKINQINQGSWIRIIYNLENYDTVSFDPNTKNLIKNSTLMQIGIPLCDKCIKSNKQITKALSAKCNQTKFYKETLLTNIKEVLNRDKNFDNKKN